MADTIFQKRIYELDEFTALAPGEPGYEDPATIWIGVDRVTWPEAKKMSLLEFISNLHKEQGPVTFNSTVVNEDFDVNMGSLNYYLNIQATRVVNKFGQDEVVTIPIVSLNKRTDGFDLVLESYQVGDSIDYLAFE